MEQGWRIKPALFTWAATNHVGPVFMKFLHRDCRWKLPGKERRAGRASCPDQRRDAVRGASSGNREAAGLFWAIVASLVGRYASTWLPPRSLRSPKIGSVPAHKLHKGRPQVAA